jgi:hypothetical protein
MQLFARLGILEAYGVTDPRDPEQLERFRQQAAADYQEFAAEVSENEE